MEYVKRNKGVIMFYLLLVITTLVIVNCNEKHFGLKNDCVYLEG